MPRRSPARRTGRSSGWSSNRVPAGSRSGSAPNAPWPTGAWPEAAPASRWVSWPRAAGSAPVWPQKHSAAFRPSRRCVCLPDRDRPGSVSGGGHHLLGLVGTQPLEQPAQLGAPGPVVGQIDELEGIGGVVVPLVVLVVEVAVDVEQLLARVPPPQAAR